MAKRKLYVEHLTKRMQLRSRNHDEKWSIFVCGIDVFTPPELNYAIVTSNVGIWGCTFEEFVENIIRYRKDDADAQKEIFTICDDPIWDDDGNEKPSPKIDDKYVDLLLHNFKTDENGKKCCELLYC